VRTFNLIFNFSGSNRFFRRAAVKIRGDGRFYIEGSFSDTSAGVINRTGQVVFSNVTSDTYSILDDYNFLTHRYRFDVTIGASVREFTFENLHSVNGFLEFLEANPGNQSCRVEVYREARVASVKRFDFSSVVTADRRAQRPSLYDIWFKKGEAILWEDGSVSLDFIFTSSYEVNNYFPLTTERAVTINNGVANSGTPLGYRTVPAGGQQDLIYTFGISKDFINNGGLFNSANIEGALFSSLDVGVRFTCLARLADADLKRFIAFLNIPIKIDGDWKDTEAVFFKVGGVWKEVDSVFVKVNNEWRETE